MRVLSLYMVAVAAAASFQTVADTHGLTPPVTVTANASTTTAPDLELRNRPVKHATTTIITHKKVLDLFGSAVSTEVKTLIPHGRLIGTCRLESNKCTYHWDNGKVQSRLCKAEDCPFDESVCVVEDNTGVRSKNRKAWCDVPKHPELGLNLSDPLINPPKPCTSPMHKGQKTWVGPSCLAEAPKPTYIKKD